MNIGVNCFGMRVPFYQDFDGALESLKKSGVTSLEATIDFPSDPEAMPDFPTDGNFDAKFMSAAIWPYEDAIQKINYVREKGFSVICVHVMSFMKSPEGLIPLIPLMQELAKKADIKYFVFSPRKSAEELLAFAPAINQVCEALAEVNAKLLIHNHEQECEMIGERTGLEVILDSCPALGVELDVGWAKFAGADCLAVMDALKDNLELVHLKDITTDACEENRNSCFTAIGEGSIPLKEILEKAAQLGLNEHAIIIDQDNSEGDMLEDIALGVKNIVACR